MRTPPVDTLIDKLNNENYEVALNYGNLELFMERAPFLLSFGKASVIANIPFVTLSGCNSSLQISLPLHSNHIDNYDYLFERLTKLQSNELYFYFNIEEEKNDPLYSFNLNAFSYPAEDLILIECNKDLTLGQKRKLTKFFFQEMDLLINSLMAVNIRNMENYPSFFKKNSLELYKKRISELVKEDIEKINQFYEFTYHSKKQEEFDDDTTNISYFSKGAMSIKKQLQNIKKALFFKKRLQNAEMALLFWTILNESAQNSRLFLQSITDNYGTNNATQEIENFHKSLTSYTSQAKIRMGRLRKDYAEFCSRYNIESCMGLDAKIEMTIKNAFSSSFRLLYFFEEQEMKKSFG